MTDQLCNHAREAKSDDLAFWEGVKWVIGVNVIVTLVCLGIGNVLWRLL